MRPEPCSFRAKTPKGNARRAVLFLRYAGAAFVNADAQFKELTEDVQDYFQTSFDYFLDDLTLRKYPHRYHSWDKSQHKGKYVNCFVFKQPPHRLYGFLSHPKSPEDNRYYVCVLVVYGKKKKWLTDTEELKRAEKMRTNLDVQRALKKFVAKASWEDKEDGE